MIEFGGWEMSLQYAGIVEEHLAVRSAAGLFDVSHMGKLLVEGARAHAFLDGLSANTIPSTSGRARYTHLLREDGTILDDVIVTCLDPRRYFLVCNAGPRAAVRSWLDTHRPAEVAVEDETDELLCLALQGPRAAELLQRFTRTDLSRIRPFGAAVLELVAPVGGAPPEGLRPPEMEGWGSATMEGPPPGPGPRGREPTVSTGRAGVLVIRTGYTGEDGFEIFPPASTAAWVWGTLLAEGASAGLRPVGLGARDTLRLEKGYLLSGQDFDGRQTPLEVGCEWVVKWDRPFLGREALEDQRDRGDHRRLIGLRMEDRGVPRHGCRVLAPDGDVGVVTSGTHSPSLRVGIALASVAPGRVAVGERVDVEIRGSRRPALAVRPPFL